MRFGVLLVGLIEFYLGSIGQGDVAVDASHLRLSCGQMVGSIKQFAGDACEMFLAGVFIVGHVDVFRGGEILVDVGHLVEEAYEFEVVVCAQHLHLGRQLFLVLDHRFVATIEHAQRGVAARDEAVEVEPLAIDVAVVGLQLEGFHGMDIPDVAFATAALVGIVGTHFAVTPVGGGAHAGVALLVGHAIEGGIGSVDQEINGFGRVHHTVCQAALRHILKKIVSASCHKDHTKGCDTYIFEFHFSIGLNR